MEKLPLQPEILKDLNISQLAHLLDGSPVPVIAQPYLKAMQSMYTINDNYLPEPGTEVIARFLANTTSLTGEAVQAVKMELIRRLRQNDVN